MVSNAPSAAFQRHHDIDAPRVDASAFRQGWRVRSRLDALLLDGWITAGVWQAACDFRTAWGSAYAQRASPLVALGGAGGDPERAMLGRIAAAARVRTVVDTLGPLRISVLVCVAVDDLSWRDLGRLLQCHHETARDAAIGVLRALEQVSALAPRSPGVLAKSTDSDPIRT